MKKKMPAFLAKKKRDPKSTSPGKNTKSRSVARGKSKKDVDSSNDRPGDMVAATPAPNKADAALAQLTKRRESRKGYQS